MESTVALPFNKYAAPAMMTSNDPKINLFIYIPPFIMFSIRPF